MKYKIGDKVKVRKDLSIGECGKEYVVREMLSRRGETAVIIAELDNCYNISGEAALWRWTDEMLEPVSDEKIVITTDGVTTIARKYDGKKLVREAKAVCSKDDEFNFDVGAKLAMERLLGGGIPEKSLYNGRVICTNNNDSPLYVTGKIYEFVNGELTENGAPLCCAPKDVIIRSLRDWQRHSIAEWLEVVE